MHGIFLPELAAQAGHEFFHAAAARRVVPGYNEQLHASLQAAGSANKINCGDLINNQNRRATAACCSRFGLCHAVVVHKQSELSVVFIVNYGALAFHPQQGDLLRNQAKHEDNHGSSEHENRHVREPSLGDISVKIVCHPGEEKEHADRQKHAEG